MHITVSSTDLKPLLAAVKATVSTRAKLPILSCVLLVAPDGGYDVLQAVTTNLEAATIKDVIAIPSLSHKAGAVCVPYKPFAAIIAALPKGEEVRLTSEGNGKDLVWHCRNASGRLRTLDVDEYPRVPGFEMPVVEEVKPKAPPKDEKMPEPDEDDGNEGESGEGDRPAWDADIAVAKEVVTMVSEVVGPPGFPEDPWATIRPVMQAQEEMQQAAQQIAPRKIAPFTREKQVKERFTFTKVGTFFEKALAQNVPVTLTTREPLPFAGVPVDPVAYDPEDGDLIISVNDAIHRVPVEIVARLDYIGR